MESDGFRLGRREATDDRHIRRWSLTAETIPSKPSPVILGIPWYGGWSRHGLVEKNGAYWIPPQPRWGSVVGGHAICLRPKGVVDTTSWWRYHDQVGGSCTGWSAVRAVTLYNRKRYSGQHVYEHAQRIDEWDDTPPEEGSSVRAAMEVLRTVGPYDRSGVPHAEDGIAAYRWTISIEDIARCLSPSDNGASVIKDGYVTLLQSWGVYFPHFVRMELDAVDRVVSRENGESVVITDK